MIRIITAVSFLALMGACSGDQPFDFAETEGEGTTGDGTTDGGTATDGAGGSTGDPATTDGGSIDSNGLPPGTAEPTSGGAILRYETSDDDGGGLVKRVSYDQDSDTFTVDNLGFDGANEYSRDNQVSALNGYAVFEADAITLDSLTGQQIGQITPYRAIYGVSNNSTADGARSSFAIVRSGGFSTYGFGGFVYERTGGVELPTSGQARFTGDYAGIRVYTGAGGMDYTRGDMTIDIDFEDFDANDAVKGRVFNREAFATDGSEITLGGAGNLVLPTLTFVIQEGADSLTENGELRGELGNAIINTEGELEEYETGQYYGILAGDATDASDGGEIVGIFVVESEDPRYEGVSVQETGGFILYR